MLRIQSEQFSIDAAEGDQPRRTISGIAVRYNTEATVSDGTKVMFAEGSLPTDGPDPKLFMYHDNTKVIGKVVSREEIPGEGMMFSARIAPTTLGDEAMILASEGALSEVSVGVQPLKFKYDKNGVMVITQARWDELSMVAHGAFDAPILDVAASIHQQDEIVSNNETQEPVEETPAMSEAVEAPQVIEASPVAQTIFAQARKEVKLPSAAEWIACAIKGGSEFAQMQANIKAAAPNVTTADSDGLLPEILVQPVYNNFRGLRPVIDAIGVRSMPSAGHVFRRPYVSTHNTVAVQSAENAALQASTYVVSAFDVTKATYGGYATISEQDLDWSDPSVLGLLLDDMARIYANKTDDVAADALLAGVTQSAVLTDPTSASEWVSDIYDAASTILTNSNGNLPDTLFLSANMFAYLGKLVDSTGRALFPQVGPMNAYGTMSPGANTGIQAFGLNVVVDRNFAADTVIVGDKSGFEIFEQQKGAISIDVPSTLSRTVAFRGYFATLMMDATKFVKLT